jgi:hypothetical protein
MKLMGADTYVRTENSGVLVALQRLIGETMTIDERACCLSANSASTKAITKEIYMKISRFTDSQIMAILKQNEAEASVPNCYREHSISL